jgi:hypothetical protein
MGVHDEQLVGRETGKSPIKGIAISNNLTRAFLKRDKYPGGTLLTRRIYETLQRKDGLASARPADKQASAVIREPAMTHVIEPFYAGWLLG